MPDMAVVLSRGVTPHHRKWFQVVGRRPRRLAPTALGWLHGKSSSLGRNAWCRSGSNALGRSFHPRGIVPIQTGSRCARGKQKPRTFHRPGARRRRKVSVSRGDGQPPGRQRQKLSGNECAGSSSTSFLAFAQTAHPASTSMRPGQLPHRTQILYHLGLRESTPWQRNSWRINRIAGLTAHKSVVQRQVVTIRLPGGSPRQPKATGAPPPPPPPRCAGSAR